MNERSRVEDPLGEALHVFRLSGTFYSRCEFTSPWAVALPPRRGSLMLYIVMSGECWLERPGAEPGILRPGDLALVHADEGHQLTSGHGVPAVQFRDLPHELQTERYEVVRMGGGGEMTTLLCGAVRFDHPAAHHLVTQFPKTVSIEATGSPEMEWIQSTIRFIATEAGSLRPGVETVITRLADSLVIQAIRTWIEREPDALPGWLGALREERIGRAIMLVHREPARGWSVATLAAEVAMSRSAFAARFTDLVGESPMQYVTRWRMQTAMTLLADDDRVTVSEVADRLGYRSEAAFSRAFKRFTGVSPGTNRRAERGEQ